MPGQSTLTVHELAGQIILLLLLLLLFQVHAHCIKQHWAVEIYNATLSVTKFSILHAHRVTYKSAKS